MDLPNPGYQRPDTGNYDSAGDVAGAWFSNVVPPEVMRSIADHMPIENMTALALSSEAMWQAYASKDGRLPYFTSFTAIRLAVQSDCDDDKTLCALRAIRKETLLSQPQFMRRFAESAPGLAKIGPAHNQVEWNQMVTSVEASLIDAFGTAWRGPQLRDLLIANVLAQFERPLANALKDRMHAFPSSMLGDFMETIDFLDIDFQPYDWETLLTSATVLSRPPSDRFARSIGLKLLRARNIDDPVRCLESFGITKMQIDHIIIPACGALLYKDIENGTTTLKSESERWGKYAEKLKNELEPSLFLAHINAGKYYHYTLPQLHAAIYSDPTYQQERQLALVRKLEYDTIQALGNDQNSIDAFLENWLMASVRVDTVAEWIEKFALLTAEGIPLMSQPALLDRWALTLTNGLDLWGKIDQTDTVYAWLNTAVTLPAFQHYPKLLGRMVVALIHALDARAMVRPAETIDAQKRLATELFENVPPGGWGWMLELVLEPERQMPMSMSERKSLFTAFVLDPLASASLATSSFCFYLVDAAADVWEHLPDQADGLRSKFDAFCERFGLSAEARVAAQKKILNGIAVRAKSGDFTLSEGLVRGGFGTDRAARQDARKAYYYGITW